MYYTQRCEHDQVQGVGPARRTPGVPPRLVRVTPRPQARPLVPAAALLVLQDPDAGVGPPRLGLESPLAPHGHHHHLLYLGQGDTHQA